MASRLQALGPAIMFQLSDTPWLLVSGALGLVGEAVAAALGVHRFTPGWALWVKVIVFNGYLLGYISFRCNRSVRGPVLAAMFGAMYLAVNQWVFQLETASPSAVTRILQLGWIAWVAVLPYLTDAIVDPWLLRVSFFRRLAANHPRYARLRPRG